MNGVIVVSPILEQYIREKYPKYKITSSTCKRITDINKLNEESDKDYDIVVLDYDFNNKFDLLEQVKNKEKCEILINACCQPNCPNRVKHYNDIGPVSYTHLILPHVLPCQPFPRFLSGGFFRQQ